MPASGSGRAGALREAAGWRRGGGRGSVPGGSALSFPSPSGLESFKPSRTRGAVLVGG